MRERRTLYTVLLLLFSYIVVSCDAFKTSAHFKTEADYHRYAAAVTAIQGGNGLAFQSLRNQQLQTVQMFAASAANATAFAESKVGASATRIAGSCSVLSLVPLCTCQETVLGLELICKIEIPFVGEFIGIDLSLNGVRAACTTTAWARVLRV
eukprot:scaffold2609_cov123-Isochrysis_galbana.AAC.4